MYIAQFRQICGSSWKQQGDSKTWVNCMQKSKQRAQMDTTLASEQMIHNNLAKPYHVARFSFVSYVRGGSSLGIDNIDNEFGNFDLLMR